MKNSDRDELDSLLEEAIGSYAREPQAGIESRILSRLRAEGNGRKSFSWLWFALPVPALLTLVLVLQMDRREPTKMPVPSFADRAPVLAIPSHVTVKAAVRQRPKLSRRALPRSDRFPTPFPLTPEERAMVEFVSRHPEETREMASRQHEAAPAPIEIHELQISPLEVGSL